MKTGIILGLIGYLSMAAFVIMGILKFVEVYIVDFKQPLPYDGNSLVALFIIAILSFGVSIFTLMKS